MVDVLNWFAGSPAHFFGTLFFIYGAVFAVRLAMKVI